MKNVLTAVLLGIILTGVSLAQGRPSSSAPSDTRKVAVLEFKDEAGLGAEGIQTLQNGIISSLMKTGKFRVVEREQLNAAARNGNLQITQFYSGAAQPAVKIGKLLGVDYLLTGRVTEFSKTDGGQLAMKVEVQLAKVGTGHLILAGANTYTGTTNVNAGTMRTSNTWTGPVTLAGSSSIGNAAVMEKVMRPVIQQLTASLKVANL